MPTVFDGMSFQGPEQEISSPWDIEIVSLNSFPGCHGDLLVIAMAGTHQIWGFALTDVVITFRGKWSPAHNFIFFTFPLPLSSSEH